jgi:anti-anti-sigma factor
VTDLVCLVASLGPPPLGDRLSDTEPIVVVVTGAVDLDAAPELLRALRSALACGPGDLVVDLGAVTFIDSSGIDVLVWGAERAAEAGGSLRLRAPSRPVRRLVDILALGGVLAIEDPR